MNRKLLLRTLWLLSLMSLFGVHLDLNAQDVQKVITGTITDTETGDPLVGATVVIVGTNNGAITDPQGRFLLNVSGEDASLIISYTGYERQEIPVGDQTEFAIALKLEDRVLKEVIIVGYGNQERAKVTGAISNVSSEEINELPVFTADQALQGRAEGVMVMNNGSPGADPVLRIRGLGTTGDNSPLIVVDGVIVQGLGDINPNDIESISVLKDASTTAIFGAQGSNGVVMITTKKGKKGQPTLTFNAYGGVQAVTNRFEVMNREQYLQHAENWGVAQGRIDDPQYADLINNDTDWQDEIFQNGIMQSYNLALAGGGEASTFRIGAGYINQEGVLLNTGSERYTFRANSDYTLGRLKIGQNLSTSIVNRQPENTAGGRSAIEHAIKMPPYLPVFNESNIGGYQGVDNSLDAQDAENPVRVLAHPQRNQNRINLLGNLYAELEIIEGLKFKTQLGLDYWQFKNDDFTPSFYGEPTAVPFAVIGKGFGTHQQVTAFSQLNYVKTFNKDHNLDVLVLGERNSSVDSRAGASSTNEITDEISNLTNNDALIGSFEFSYLRIGYLGRLNYDYQGKYIFAGSYRRDASSRFGSNNRWAGFYSLAAGWVISSESFFPQDGPISFLKLRASQGTVGNDRIGDYRYSSSINTGSYNTSFVDALSGETYLGPGTTAGNVASPDLRWETTTMTNVGFDMHFFNGALQVSGEYYRNLSDDLLVNVQLTPSLGGHNGFGPRNVGSVLVDGLEFNIGYNDAFGDFRWSTNLNLSTTQNTVVDLGGEVIQNGNFENVPLLRSTEQLPLNHFFGFVTDGIFQSTEEILTSPLQENAQPGDIKFRDISGPDGVPDGIIDDQDKTLIGNPIPDVTLGFSANAEYKNFDFSVLIIGMYGNEIYNTNIWDLEGGRRFFNAGPQALDAWTPTNRDTDIPRITTDPQNLQPSTRFIEDGSFTRLKNIILGYTIPDLPGNLGKVRFYISGQNLYTLTNYSGLDPEVGSSALVGNNSSQVGVDRGNYPLPKSFIGGIQLNF